MYRESNYFFKKVFKLYLSFFIIIIFSSLSFCQINSLKQLKKNANDLNILKQSIKSSDPWTIDHLITADELANDLKNSKTNEPLILQVGFKFLYNIGHIPGAIYAGPGSEKSGIESIKDEVKSLKKIKNIVIYCGCCPWGHCPNIRPAYTTLKNLGFTNVKVLYIPQNFGKDWADKGYPEKK